MHRRALALLALAALALGPVAARAQAKAPVAPVAAPLEVFSAEEVSGEFVRPRLSASDVLPEKRHVPKSLIAVRGDFRGRLLASAGAL